MKVSTYVFLYCLGVCLFIPGLAFAEQKGLVVESVSFHKDNNQQERVRIKLNGPGSPKVYTMDGDNKPRLVIDIPAARYSGLITPIVNEDSLIKKIRIGVHAEPSPKVRVVLDLEPGRKYTYTRDFLKQENVLNVNLVPTALEKRPESAVTQIDAEDVKLKMLSGPKKIIAPDTSQGQAPVDAKPAEKIDLPVKPAEAAAKAVVQTVSEAGDQAMAKPAQVPVAQDKTAAQSPAPDQSKVAEAAKPAAKPEVQPEVKPAVKPEVKPPVEAVSVPAEKEKADKAAVAPPAQPTAKAKEKEEAAKVAGQPPAAAIPEKTAEQKKSEQVTSDQAEVPAGPDPQLVDITFENNSSKGEMIFFHLNGFFPPNVSAVESDSPQVVCEFVNMTKEAKIKPVIEARGAYVQRIETTVGQEPKKLKVTLVLTPQRDYDLRQVFFKEDNLFVLVVNSIQQAADQKK